MRNVILLHARANSVLAEEVVARNPRVALTCGIDRVVPPGRFGDQFHMVALWSREAALDGLEWVMAEALSGRESESIVLVMDGVVVPSCLAGVGMQIRISPMTDLAALFESFSPSTESFEVDIDEERVEGRRRPVAVAATAAFSIGAGALLAHAASPYGLVPTAATPTYTPTAHTAAAPVVDEAETLPVIEAVDTRFNAVRAAAADVAQSPAVYARFERVKSIAVSDLLLAQMAQRANEQSQSVFSAGSAAPAIATADVAPVRIAAAEVETPITLALSDAPSDRTTF